MNFYVALSNSYSLPVGCVFVLFVFLGFFLSKRDLSVFLYADSQKVGDTPVTTVLKKKKQNGETEEQLCCAYTCKHVQTKCGWQSHILLLYTELVLYLSTTIPFTWVFYT